MHGADMWMPDEDDAAPDDAADDVADGRERDALAPETEATAYCPYCGEPVELLLDPGGGDAQEYVEDCEVCCRPWLVQVSWDRDGRAIVELATDDA